MYILSFLKDQKTLKGTNVGKIESCIIFNSYNKTSQYFLAILQKIALIIFFNILIPPLYSYTSISFKRFSKETYFLHLLILLNILEAFYINNSERIYIYKAEDNELIELPRHRQQTVYRFDKKKT